MSRKRSRAVFTGIGVVTPIGLGRDAFWQGLIGGQCGIRRLEAFDVSPLPCKIAADVRGFDAKQYIDRKERKSLKVMARPIQFAVAGTTIALADAKIESNQLDPTRFGVEFGAGLIASELEELGPAARTSVNCQPGHVDMVRWGQHGIPSMPPLWMLKYLPNMLACHVSILQNAQGPNNTITETDVAPLLAIGEGYRIIQRGQADVMLTGGADSKLNPLSFTRQNLFMALSNCDDPAKASRPFDRRRSGLVLGEGAGILVLEELEHAQKRGARIYAEVVGFGTAFDLRRNGEGVARAITMALQHAGVTPDQIDHINAQGFSTVRDDVWEARGLQRVFGSCTPPVPVFAGKSYFGSLGAGGAAVELAASLLAIEHGVVPPTLNHEETDPECPVTVLAREPKKLDRDHVLKVSFTDMGQVAALVIRKFAGA